MLPLIKNLFSLSQTLVAHIGQDKSNKAIANVSVVEVLLILYFLIIIIGITLEMEGDQLSLFSLVPFLFLSR